MIQVKNGQVWAANEAISELLKEPWPVKTAYGLAKLARRLGEQHGVIDRVRMGLITRYGEKAENGQIRIQPEGEHWTEFVAEFNELMNEEATIECMAVRLPDSHIEVLPSLLVALEPFITMDNDCDASAVEAAVAHLVAVQ